MMPARARSSSSLAISAVTSVPLGAWLRGPLREWAESLVSVERLSHEDLLNATPIRDAWRRVDAFFEEHLRPGGTPTH